MRRPASRPLSFEHGWPSASPHVACLAKRCGTRSSCRPSVPYLCRKPVALGPAVVSPPFARVFCSRFTLFPVSRCFFSNVDASAVSLTSLVGTQRCKWSASVLEQNSGRNLRMSASRPFALEPRACVENAVLPDFPPPAWPSRWLAVYRGVDTSVSGSVPFSTRLPRQCAEKLPWPRLRNAARAGKRTGSFRRSFSLFPPFADRDDKASCACLCTL